MATRTHPRTEWGGSRPSPTLVVGGAAGAPRAEPCASVDEDAEAFFELAGDIAVLLAGAPEGDAALAPLALPLALSACMVNHGVDPEGLIDAMLPLRRALIDASALDASIEPVPLTVGEPADAALRLASYLHGLLVRAAAASDLHPDALASAAADLLRSA